MEVVSLAEDEVTQLIIRRLVSDYNPLITSLREEPVRGGMIEDLIPKYNLLSSPTIGLIDLDSGCAVTKLESTLRGNPLRDRFCLRIAVEEAETWLLADTVNCALYLGISSDLIPAPRIDPFGNGLEIILPYKVSLWIGRELGPNSNNNYIRNGLQPLSGRTKGPLHNTIFGQFIDNYWNPEVARLGSNSLNKAIDRIRSFT